MVRTVEFDVYNGKVQKKWAGMQYEDNATLIVFKLPNDYIKAGATYRIDFNSPGAGYQPSENLGVGTDTVERYLPKSVTQFGGEIQVTLVISFPESNTYPKGESISYPAIIWLTDVEKDENGEVTVEGNISEMEAKVQKTLLQTEYLKKKTVLSAEKAMAAAERTEAARLALLENGAEFIFQGGTAESSSMVDFTLEQIVSEASNNPVSSKAIAAAINAAANMAILQAVQQALLSAHPVGSLYFSAEPTEPSTLFGGEWERVKDKFILAAGDLYEAGSIGGEAEHTLTLSEMPRHNHLSNGGTLFWISEYGNLGATSGSSIVGASTLNNNGVSTGTSIVGGSEPFNNMPPYEAYYCWKRIA